MAEKSSLIEIPDQKTITVIVREEDSMEKTGADRGGDRGGLTLLSEHMRAARIPVSASTLQRGIDEFLDVMREAIGKVATTVGDFHLETISLSAEVSATGKLELLGTGGELGGKAGITFEFKRK